MGLLEVVKKALLIPLSETYADLELQSHIDACKTLIESSGVSLTNIDNNKLAHSLVIIYVKTFFGFKNDGSVKELPKSFDMLLSQLVLSGGETNVS